MKLLITGGAGFIGSNFVHYWRENHPADEIVVLDKLTYAGNLANLESVKDAITFIEGDITDSEAVRRAMTDVDCVVHFAAETHVDRSIHDPYIFTRTNVLGTHVLLEVARQLNIQRLHHVSTDEVFGEIPLDEDWKFNESTPYHPNSPYSASKAASDHLVRSYGATYNLPFTISNCSNNFGPFHYPEKFIPRSIIRLLKGENIRLYTPGNQIRDWLHVKDHCRAIDAILQKGKLGETYCIGGLAKGISNIEVAKKILQILNLPEDRLELVTDRPGHDVKYDIDWTKIHTELGWEPEHSFDEWLQATVNWYQENEQWWQELYKESESFYQSKGEKII
jgi:dTDP-glucose 4,6-dehydratase